MHLARNLTLCAFGSALASSCFELDDSTSRKDAGGAVATGGKDGGSLQDGNWSGGAGTGNAPGGDASGGSAGSPPDGASGGSPSGGASGGSSPGGGGACAGGWADCNGNPSDGCETNLSTSVAHCSACNSPCSVANATATCSGGQCTFTCIAPFADCDGMSSNGCEVNTDTSDAHCGGCGYACSLSCNAGVCCNKCVTDCCAEGEKCCTIGGGSCVCSSCSCT